MAELNETHTASTLEALEECVHACSDCAAHDIREGDMVECALICLDCADICSATLKVMARHSAHHGDFAKLCAHICRECAAECGKHAHEHCRVCALTCETCAAECDKHSSEVDA